MFSHDREEVCYLANLIVLIVAEAPMCSGDTDASLG